jgi:Bacterial Ig-like domain (group 2)
MRNTLRRLAAVFCLAALATAAACSDSPTGGSQVNRDEAKLGFAINVANTSIQTLVVEVTAPDITSRLVFNVPVSNGVANGSITVPAGSNRTVAVRAYDAQGTLTHEGSRTVDVRPGANVTITIPLIPKAGQLPITINFGSLVVSISRTTPTRPAGDAVGDTVRFRGVVLDPDANQVPGSTVRWATLDPSIATVDSTGLVTARGVGVTEIVGTYGGFGASVAVTVVAGGGSGPDVTAPQLVGFTISPDSVDAGASEVPVTFTFQVLEAGSGIVGASIDLYAPEGSPFPNARGCIAYPSITGGSPTAQTLTCTVELPAYAAPGRWTVNGMAINDRAGNVRFIYAPDLAAAGFPTGVTVVNPNPDFEAPVLSAFARTSPDTVRTYESVSFTLQASDAGTGITDLRVSIGTSSPNGSMGTSCTATPTGVGDEWSCQLFMQSYFPAGEWEVTSVTAFDAAGNASFYGPEELAAFGASLSFTYVQ